MICDGKREKNEFGKKWIHNRVDCIKNYCHMPYILCHRSVAWHMSFIMLSIPPDIAGVNSLYQHDGLFVPSNILTHDIWYKSKCVRLYGSGLFNACLWDLFGCFIVYQVKIISLLTYEIIIAHLCLCHSLCLTETQIYVWIACCQMLAYLQNSSAETLLLPSFQSPPGHGYYRDLSTSILMATSIPTNAWI